MLTAFDMRFRNGQWQVLNHTGLLFEGTFEACINWVRNQI